MDKNIKISFTGDILVYKCQNRLSKIGRDSYDYFDYLSHTKQLFENSDYVVGSLETPLAGRKQKYTSEDTNFNTPDDILKAIKNVGITMLTTGNNHALDRGKEGLLRTIEVLERGGFDYTGTSNSPNSKRYIVKNIKGIKIAFLSYSYGTNSASNECLLKESEEYMINLTRLQDQPPHRTFIKRCLISLFMLLPKSIRKIIRPEAPPRIIDDCVSNEEINSPRNDRFIKRMLNDVDSAKKESDIVFFCLHSGGQFNSEVSGYTKWLVDIIVDAGVDAVICNHTHTPLPVEVRPNGCVVAYSLGNFCFTPGVGYYISGVDAEFSNVLHVKVDENKKRVVGYTINKTKCEVDLDGKAHVVVVD